VKEELGWLDGLADVHGYHVITGNKVREVSSDYEVGILLFG